MFWQSQSIFANKWMPSNEYARTSATYTGAYFFLCVGFLLSGIVFSGPEVDVKAALNTLIFRSNIVVTLIYAFFMLAFKHKPAVPPSRVATHDVPKRHLSESFHELRTNKNFLFILLSYIFSNGPYMGSSAIMALILVPFGFSIAQISWIGALGMIVGAPLAVVFGSVLDKTRAYKKSLIVCPTVLLLFSVLFPRLVLNSDSGFIIVVSTMMIFFSVSLIMSALSMAFSIEVTYPLNGSIINGTLQIFMQVIATILAVGGTLWLATDYSQGTPTP